MKFQVVRTYLSIQNLFIFSAIVLGVYLRGVFFNTPIQDYQWDRMVKPNLDLSAFEVLTVPYHSELFIFKTIISNWLFNLFGVNGFSYRFLAFCLSIGTLYLIYRFVSKEFSKRDAGVALFLFSISYFSIWTVYMPDYGSTYIFASFLMFCCLWKLSKENKWRYWAGFSVLNFINLSNSLVTFLFVPTVIFLAAVIFFNINNVGKGKIGFEKDKVISFLIWFFISTVAALFIFQLRGVSIIQACLDILTHGKFLEASIIPVPGQGKYEIESGRWTLFWQSIKYTFLTLNFDREGSSTGYSFVGWVYLGFLLIGWGKVYSLNKKLFLCIPGYFLIPPVFSAFVLNISHSRSFAFVIPIYLILVSVGMGALCDFLKKIKQFSFFSNSIYLLTVFIVLSWVAQPKPIWSYDYLDKLFTIRGMPAVRDYLAKQIKPNDIILNVTRTTELRSEVGDALSFPNYEQYLEEFFKQHRLELLPGRVGKTGIWLILREPLDESSPLLPFYFPVGYHPRLKEIISDNHLYYGELILNNSQDISDDSIFNTPFWLFHKARFFQERRNFRSAEIYYQGAIKSGFNTERAIYNLGMMHGAINYNLALKFFNKAIQILETPTPKPPGVLIKEQKPNLVGLRNMAASFKEFEKYPPIRYYWKTIGGERYKYRFREDYIFYNPRIYSNFYITPGLLTYLLFDQTKNEEFFKQAMSLFEKGLKLYPTSPLLPLIQKLKNREMKNITPKDFGPIYVADLNAVYEDFPPIEK
jgi:tetratricopeptide (TPR) repeat protein